MGQTFLPVASSSTHQAIPTPPPPEVDDIDNYYIDDPDSSMPLPAPAPLDLDDEVVEADLNPIILEDEVRLVESLVSLCPRARLTCYVPKLSGTHKGRGWPRE